jgi:hypothetical protein
LVQIFLFCFYSFFLHLAEKEPTRDPHVRMGRTVVVDETGVEAYTQQRLFAAGVTREQVGLLVGQLRARDSEDCFVIGLIPTPLPEVEPTAGNALLLNDQSSLLIQFSLHNYPSILNRVSRQARRRSSRPLMCSTLSG